MPFAVAFGVCPRAAGAAPIARSGSHATHEANVRKRCLSARLRRTCGRGGLGRLRMWAYHTPGDSVLLIQLTNRTQATQPDVADASAAPSRRTTSSRTAQGRRTAEVGMRHEGTMIAKPVGMTALSRSSRSRRGTPPRLQVYADSKCTQRASQQIKSPSLRRECRAARRHRKPRAFKPRRCPAPGVEPVSGNGST